MIHYGDSPGKSSSRHASNPVGREGTAGELSPRDRTLSSALDTPEPLPNLIGHASHTPNRLKYLALFFLPLLLLAGCRIEQTPAAYIDHVGTPQDDLRASEEELMDRLRSIAPALQREDYRSIVAALAPSDELTAFGPEKNSLAGGAALGTALAGATGGQAASAEDLVVRVELQNTIAWFRVAYRVVTPVEDDLSEVRFTGVFARQEGEWRLVQGHISNPLTPPAADSVQADPPAAGG